MDRVVVDVALVLATVPSEPWRNGAGRTRTVARGGGPAGRWRVSLAEVTDGAPFSPLPGTDRVFLPLRAGSVDLHGPDGPLPVGPDRTVRFDGALAVTARVVDGSALACNVMAATGSHRISTTLLDGTVVVHLEPQETP